MFQNFSTEELWYVSNFFLKSVFNFDIFTIFLKEDFRYVFNFFS